MPEPLYGVDCATGEVRAVTCTSDGALRIGVDGVVTAIYDEVKKKPKLGGRVKDPAGFWRIAAVVGLFLVAALQVVELYVLLLIAGGG